MVKGHEMEQVVQQVVEYVRRGERHSALAAVRILVATEILYRPIVLPYALGVVAAML